MKIPALALAGMILATPVSAAEHVVTMLNAGPDGTRMAFDPAIVRAASGDTVVFVSGDNGHSVASVIVPTGGETWEGDLDVETRVTVTVPGTYLFKSKPHFALGMIGLIVVDTPEPNLGDIDAFRPRGSLMRERFEALRSQL